MATSDKYDRQLRLWGAHGQRALGETTVVLVRATAAGTETLKNLTLPGVGRIVLVDDDDVEVVDNAMDNNNKEGEEEERTMDSNFFTPPQQQPSSNENNNQPQQQPRARVALEHLQELNPDVRGHWRHLESSLMDWEGEELAQQDKTLVVGSDLEPPLRRKVSKLCSQQNVPLILVDSYGLVGSVRLQTPPLPLLEPKPENEPPDLRLVTAFDGLLEYSRGIAWDELDDAQHGHVPYPLILLRLQDEWKLAHNNTLPSTFAEKQQFRNSIRAASRKWDHELNFQEAAQNAYLAYTERTVDADHLNRLLQNTSPQVCPKLHALLQALQVFLQQQHHQQRAPLQGTIPDMTASTDMYVTLQRLYRDQAAKDVAGLKRLVKIPVSDEDVTTFCRNVFSLDLLTTRTLLEEEDSATATPCELVDEWKMALLDPYEVPEHTPLLWYVALRACRVFYDKHGRYPGTTINYTDDVPLLQDCIVSVARHMQLQDEALVRLTLLSAPEAEKYAHEMTRYAQAELHNIASVVGGVASQEAVKIITGQYVPFNNTYIYNGIASTGGVYQF